MTRTGRSRPVPAPPFLLFTSLVHGFCEMILRWLRRAAAPNALSIVSPGDDRPRVQGTNDPDALTRQVEQLYQASRYAEATDIAKEALALAERKFGSDHPAVAKTLNNLATLYFVQGRDADAEPLFKCALVVLKRALGPDHLEVAAARNYMAGLRIEQGERAGVAANWGQNSVTASFRTTSVDPPIARVPKPTSQLSQHG
jgi:tetratricopeptide (TPR) repeat protein